jgi:ABC-type uncharacterized transport system permease subunit
LVIGSFDDTGERLSDNADVVDFIPVCSLWEAKVFVHNVHKIMDETTELWTFPIDNYQGLYRITESFLSGNACILSVIPYFSTRQRL